MKYVKISFLLIIIAVSLGFGELIVADFTGGDDSAAEPAEVSSYIYIDIERGESMTASWYGPKFHGNPTANGEIYDQMAFTAAHKDLPFGTMLRVTNPVNGRSAIVRINDRGPYIEGRDIDLSKGTALSLGMLEKGVIEVEVEKLMPERLLLPVETLN